MRNLDESKSYNLEFLNKDELKDLFNELNRIDLKWRGVFFKNWSKGTNFKNRHLVYIHKPKGWFMLPKKENSTNAKELFGSQGITEEASLNQVPDDSKLVSEREVPISIKIAETEREIILKKISEQDLEMIDKKPSLLQEAEQIINGSRAEDYGSVTENFEKIAKGWEMIFSKGEFTPRNVANAMIWLKICRDTNTPKYDNPLDIAGYAGCIGKMINEEIHK